MNMDSWMQDMVSMMAEGSISRVKQEIETTSCSPTPSTGNQAQSIIYGNSSQTSPGSPDRQFCSSTTTTYGEISSDLNNQNSLKEDLPKRLCLVCGDTASGFHYGVASCEACKAFFKRTIQGNIEYTCPANNECEINKRRRKACQACRFQKCLYMGMLKEGVRLDRVRGGRQKYRRNPTSNPYQMQVLYQPSITSLDDIKILEVLSSFEPEPISCGHIGIDVLNRIDDHITEQKHHLIDDKSLIFTRNNDGGISSSSGSSTTTTTTATKITESDVYEILDIIGDLYDQELVLVIGWAKQIPGFIKLPIDDQMKLLQLSWAEILTLQLAHRSIPFNGKLNFATDFWLDEHTAKECGISEFYYHCVQIIQRLERLSPRKEEYYLLKALTLSNCDIRLDDYFMLRKFRDSILSALNDCVYLTRHSSAVSHQQQLLLVLPSLRQVNQIVREFWIRIYHEGNVKLNKLFIEMLESVPR